MTQKDETSPSVRIHSRPLAGTDPTRLVDPNNTTGRRDVNGRIMRPGQWAVVPADLTRDDRFINSSLEARYLYTMSFVYSNREQCDGKLGPAHFRRLAFECQLSETEARNAAEELVESGLWWPGYRLVGYLAWNYSAAEREAIKAADRERHAEKRKKVSLQPFQESSETEIEAEAGTSLGRRRDSPPRIQIAPEDTMPRQDDMITITRAWEEIVGHQAMPGEIHHIGRLWLDQYDRLTASQIAKKIREVATRPGQEPITSLKYFDPILRELNDANRPSGTNGAAHQLEPVVAVVLRGVDANGNPEPPEPIRA